VNAEVDDYGGHSALYFAVCNGQEDIVRFLLEHRANPLKELLCLGGMSKWACSDSQDEVVQEVDMASRNRIIELVLSSSVARVKVQMADKTDIDKSDWNYKCEQKEYCWVFMDCVRHGYKVGIDQLMENSNFEFPPTCLQLAAAVGDHVTLLYLLRAGALASYDDNNDEERWYGPSYTKPSDASVRRCKGTLNCWLETIMNKTVEEHGTLQQACCAVLHKHGISFSPQMELVPDDIRDQVLLACPPSS